MASREKGRFAFWVHAPLGDWIAAQRLVRQGDALVVTELRVFPAERPPLGGGTWSGRSEGVPAGGISASLLRGAAVGRHVAAPVVMDWVEAMLSEGWPRRHRALAQRVASELGIGLPDRRPEAPTGGRSRPGRKPRSRAFYEEVAKDYRRWSTDEPAKRIAEKWKVSRATARTWIHAARHKLALLPKTEPGRRSVFVQKRTR